jgi:hypothetical protein
VIASCISLDYYGVSSECSEFREHETRNYWLTHMPKIRGYDWDELDQLEKNCAFWCESQRLVLEGLAGHGQSLRIKLEDLLADDAAISELFRFLSLPLPARDKLDALRATKINDRSIMKKRISEHAFRPATFGEWPEAWRVRMRERCAGYALRLGYDLDAPL